MFYYGQNKEWRYRKKLKTMPILAKIGNYRLQGKEHLEWMAWNHIPKAAMQYKPKDKGDRGRPRKRWIETGIG